MPRQTSHLPTIIAPAPGTSGMAARAKAKKQSLV
jgi:hypothetical protein